MLSKIKRWYLFSRRGSYFMLLMVCLPVLLLAGFGGFAIIKHGYGLIFIGSLLLSTLLGLLPLWWRRRPLTPVPNQPIALDLQQAVTTPEYWSEFDQGIQQQLLPVISGLVQAPIAWSQLHIVGLKVLRSTAEQYQQNNQHAEWAFTAPELLTAVEQASQRLQQLLDEHVPGVDQVKLSALLWANTQRQRLQPLSRLYQIYRKVRMVTPEGIIAELRSQFFDRAFAGLNDELQSKLQQLILLEVLQLAIDLYGGHLRHLNRPLALSKAAAQDAQRLALEPEPIRVAFVGQENAGKSSLINSLLAQFKAETDGLPATDQVQAYPFGSETAQPMLLLDLPGLHGARSQQQLKEYLELLADCEVIVWVLKANQSARQLDVALRQALDAWLQQRLQRQQKLPLIVGALTHADRLADHSTLLEAQQYNQQLLALPTLLVPNAVILPEAQQSLAEQLNEYLLTNYDAALNVQLQRRRIEGAAFSFKKEFQRFSKGGKHMVKTLLNSQSPPS